VKLSASCVVYHMF